MACRFGAPWGSVGPAVDSTAMVKASGELPYVSAQELTASIPMPALLDAVEAAFRDVAAGNDRSPLRAHVDTDAGDLLVMPGVRAGGAGFTVKLVTVVAGNAARGLPTVQAVVVWFDGETGRPVALIDGAALTAMRTGAASGVATRLLARPDSSVLALIGAGAQAEWQLRAVAAARPIERCLVYAPSAEARESFASRLGVVVGVEVEPVATADDAVRRADVVCCATTSSTPVFDAAAVRDGTHVNGIGAYRLDMVELPPDLFVRAEVVAVDSREAALAEAGDVVAALDSGAIASVDHLVEIGTVARGWAERRPADSVTAFKSVGLAIQDVAAAELAVRSRGAGRA
jgi:ornithine cyclodeaminase/alanine dehydrogenase-like protein (mu-crystallin family)